MLKTPTAFFTIEENLPVMVTGILIWELSAYTVLWNSFKRIVKDFSPDEKAELFHDAAVRAYGAKIEEGGVA